ncbi:tyrosine-type recombinase/integrase [Maritalea myrionectae]|uniref:tyrosine-type recombinase/integrase n=1 Tax=Maritalea myrionectae TaxID=454601 RepID=UPI00041286EC|nr:tyrosine-type recombinase/integrase [Maritalea myrionectae]
MILTDTKLKKISPKSKPVADVQVQGLYFFPSSTKIGNGKWLFRYTSPLTRKRREMGLGRFPEKSLKEARREAFEHRIAVEDGLDPLREKEIAEADARSEHEIPDFASVARKVYREISPSFRNPKHSAQWINTIEKFVIPQIGSIKVNELRPVDFANCLRPLWLSKPETATRVKQRCDRIMKWCAAHGYILASPVSVVDDLLPRQPSKRERVVHHPALPWREIPGFVVKFLTEGHLSSTQILLKLLLLTATRSGEIRGMNWAEVDLDNAIWTIPADRMKASAAHRIPLAKQVVQFLQELHNQRICETNLVVPSSRNTPLSDMAFTKFLREQNITSDVIDRHATAHGFRSSFRDWASENGFQRDLAERALAHTIKSSTEAAYHRTDLLEQRREMMQQWADFCLRN